MAHSTLHQGCPHDSADFERLRGADGTFLSLSEVDEDAAPRLRMRENVVCISYPFRVYPLVSTIALMQRKPIGCRMDFDPEIAVRLYWDGVPIRNVETEVCYPEAGLSHFQLFWDNVRISWMHTRLLAGMVGRFPQLLLRKRPHPFP